MRQERLSLLSGDKPWFKVLGQLNVSFEPQSPCRRCRTRTRASREPTLTVSPAPRLVSRNTIIRYPAFLSLYFK